MDTDLNDLRASLREGFNRSGLYSDIDKRYKLVTAHATAIRFCSPVENRGLLLELCEQYRDHDFGTIRLSEFELVFNNWYQNLSVTRRLAKHIID